MTTTKTAAQAAEKLKLSPAGYAVLRNKARGLPADHGLRGRSAFGGHESTMRALRKRGLIDEENNITAAGVAALGAKP